MEILWVEDFEMEKKRLLLKCKELEKKKKRRKKRKIYALARILELLVVTQKKFIFLGLFELLTKVNILVPN